MEVIAVVSAVLIAVGGWIVNQSQARRAVRRNTRIDYLLAAYRRLERSSNRPMTEPDDREVESAVADMQLFGSATQVRLASEFAKTFGAEGTRDTEPLLQDLRASLRRELLLEAVPPNRVWLRINRAAGTALERSRVWHESDQTANRAVRVELAGETVPLEFGEPFLAEMTALVAAASPGAAVEASSQRVEHALRARVAAAVDEDVNTLNASQLVNRSLQLGLIDAQLADAITGLGVMRLIATTERDGVSAEKAMDFVRLSSAVLYVLSRPRPPARQ